MSSDIPEPTPDPVVPDSWFQRPAFLATSALIVVLVGAALWFLGRENDNAAETPSPTGVTQPATSDTEPRDVTTPPTGETFLPATPTTVLNPFGDVIGETVETAASPAARFAAAVQQGADPAEVAALHTPAYYYALWSRLTQRAVDPEAPLIATASGYTLTLADGPVELVDLRPREALIREGTEIRDGIPVALADAVQLTGVCQPDVEPQCDLSGANFAPDARGSDAQMWALAKIVLAADTDTWILYLDLKGATVASATAEGSTAVGFDGALNIVAVSYAKSPPPGTVLTLVASATDGTEYAFDFAVS
jgi:hypothetical protein